MLFPNYPRTGSPDQALQVGSDRIVEVGSEGWRYQIALADFDRDGAIDIVVPAGGWTANGERREYARVYRGQGDGTFMVSESYPADSQQGQSGIGFAVYAADLNRDQFPDLVMRSPSSSIEVRLGKGDGTFGPEIALVGPDTPSFITVADLDGDGAPDLATVSGQAPTVSIYLGSGDGTFGSRKDLAVGATPNAVLATDWNGDGTIDLIATDDYLHLLLGTGKGNFAPVLDCGLSLMTSWGDSSPVPVIGDFDRDGVVDLVSSNRLFLGMQECNFTKQTTVHVVDNVAYWLAAGDFNGDGTTDLAVAYENGIGFLPGDGRGNLGALVKLGDLGDIHKDPRYNTGYAADVNGDGRLDLIVANQDSIRVFLNTCK